MRLLMFAGGSSVLHQSRELLEMLSRSSLFNGLTRWECEEIASLAGEQSFKRNEILFQQGQPEKLLIYLQSGTVKHSQLDGNGREVILWMSGPGDAVNLETWPTEGGHAYSARAAEKCHTLTWDFVRLQGLLARYPRIAMNINRILAERLEELEERFREVVTEPITRRLARLLLRLTRQVGRSGEDGVQIPATHAELGRMIGTTRPAVAKLLAHWAQSGIVGTSKAGVIIQDHRKLESVCENHDLPQMGTK